MKKYKRKLIFIISLVIILSIIVIVYFPFMKENKKVDEVVPSKTNLKDEPHNVKKEENFGTLQKNANVIEIRQQFLNSDDTGLLLSQVYDLNIQEDVSFIAMSAHTLDKDLNTSLFYRTYMNSNWSEWEEMHENTEDYTPDRKTFQRLVFFNKIEKIQFKSSKNVLEDIVFLLFVSIK